MIRARAFFNSLLEHSAISLPVRAEEGLGLAKARLEAPLELLKDAASTSSAAPQDEPRYFKLIARRSRS